MPNTLEYHMVTLCYIPLYYFVSNYYPMFSGCKYGASVLYTERIIMHNAKEQTFM